MPGLCADGVWWLKEVVGGRELRAAIRQSGSTRKLPTYKHFAGQSRRSNWSQQLFRSHHPRAESRQLSVGSGASGSVPKGNHTVVNLEEFPAIPLAVVA